MGENLAVCSDTQCGLLVTCMTAWGVICHIGGEPPTAVTLGIRGFVQLRSCTTDNNVPCCVLFGKLFMKASKLLLDTASQPLYPLYPTVCGNI